MTHVEGKVSVCRYRSGETQRSGVDRKSSPFYHPLSPRTNKKISGRRKSEEERTQNWMFHRLLDGGRKLSPSRHKPTTGNNVSGSLVAGREQERRHLKNSNKNAHRRTFSNGEGAWRNFTASPTLGLGKKYQKSKQQQKGGKRKRERLKEFSSGSRSGRQNATEGWEKRRCRLDNGLEIGRKTLCNDP